MPTHSRPNIVFSSSNRVALSIRPYLESSARYTPSAGLVCVVARWRGGDMGALWTFSMPACANNVGRELRADVDDNAATASCALRPASSDVKDDSDRITLLKFRQPVKASRWNPAAAIVDCVVGILCIASRVLAGTENSQVRERRGRSKKMPPIKAGLAGKQLRLL